MKTIGIDIGTTTISAVVMDELSGVLATINVKNEPFIFGEAWERIQDANQILKKAFECVNELITQFSDVQAIGVTGQMHGIVYLDDQGNCVSPLYTWQDGRGDLPYDEQLSWAKHLSELSGYELSTGYGLVTHAYNIHHDLVPETAVTFCTIADYVAMKLANLKTPRLDATNGASLGMFDVLNGQFDTKAIEKTKIDWNMLPLLAESSVLGVGIHGVPIFVAIGDNQASFLGATEGKQDALLINMGTGGQVSILSEQNLQTSTLETRPYFDGKWLLVGASLCGGRSYALLERFFRQTVKVVTGEDVDAYEAMEKMLDNTSNITNLPRSITTFQGTRLNPTSTGSMTGITEDNFTPEHFTWSIMQGMAQELYDLYVSYLNAGGKCPIQIIGSGNGLRKNPWLCKVFEQVFKCSMTLSQHDEEAACGAAIYAAQHLSI